MKTSVTLAPPLSSNGNFGYDLAPSEEEEKSGQYIAGKITSKDETKSSV